MFYFSKYLPLQINSKAKMNIFQSLTFNLIHYINENMYHINSQLQGMKNYKVA